VLGLAAGGVLSGLAPRVRNAFAASNPSRQGPAVLEGPRFDLTYSPHPVNLTGRAGGNDAIAGRLDVEYAIPFTQRLILSPELELDFYSNDDFARDIGSGLSTLELGLRLRYEIRREFAPYIGINWEKKLSNTADLARDDGQQTGDLQVVLGVRAWF
jgi:uncharacterized protein involved in copper resistance